jgi:hypothetical protein
VIRKEPIQFAKSLVKAVQTINLPLFAFSTFPACYGFFTRPESVVSASMLFTELLALDKAPEGLVLRLFQSFLFSAYLFTDALWSHFHTRLCSKRTFDEQSAINGLRDSVEACRSLVSAPLVATIQAVLGRFPRLCCSAVLRFLRVSFDLWYDYSPEGMSFAGGESFRAFLRGSEVFEVGNSITIVSALIGGKRRVPHTQNVLPSSDLPPEALVLSNGDFDLYQKAFKLTDEKISYFHAIESPKNEPFATPYMLDFFSRTKDGPGNEGPLIAPPELPPVALEADSLYEQAIVRNVSIGGPTFAEYRARKALLESRRRMEELEDLLRIRLEMQTTEDMQRSVLRLRNYAFGQYAARFIVPRKVRSQRIEDEVNAGLVDCPERKTLLETLFVAYLNTIQMPTAPAEAVQKFTAIKRRYIETAWTAIGTFDGKKRIIDLIPEPTRRHPSRVGEVVLLFGQFFGKCRKVTQHFRVPEGGIESFFKFVTFASEYEGLLPLYLCVTHLFEESPFFMKQIDKEHNWKQFLEMMTRTMQTDETL